MTTNETNKYVLKKYHRDVPDEALLDDLRRVSQIVGKDTVKQLEYRQHGQFHDNTLCSRFGSWNTVLKKAGLAESTFRMDIADDELF